MSAKNYLSYVNDHAGLTEDIKALDINAHDGPVENGHAGHEVNFSLLHHF